jgi:glycosyltransferase involved in cell wall biosynthesis
MASATVPRPRLDPLLDAPLVGPRVLSLVGEWAIACNMWRVWQPAAFLKLHGYPVEWGWTRDWRTALFHPGFDALSLCRASWMPEAWQKGTSFVARQHRAGRKVFYDCDDDLFTPFSDEHQRGRIPQPGEPPTRTDAELEAERQSARWMLAHADGVTVSTQYLASVVRRFTDAPVEVVPNAIDAEWFLTRQRGVPRPVPGLTIGWAGGNRPDADFAEMAVAWGRIARRSPEVTFLVVGHQSPLLHEHVPQERVVRLPWREPNEYPAALVGIDIACCPLAERPFNRAKTPIKVWEAGLSGSAVVASPTVYKASLDGGRTGFLAETADAWEEAIAILLRDEGIRRRMAQELKRDVLARCSLKQHYWRWPAAWNRLMEGS